MSIETVHKHRLPVYLAILVTSTLLAACGDGGGGSDGGGSTASVTSASTATITGTVPGTRIEAFGDNGAYYAVNSTDNGTSRHPFSMEVPAGLGLRIVMTTNEGSADEVISPIGFRDNTTQVHTRFMLGAGDRIDLGYIPLAMSRAGAAGDVDGDGDNDDLDHDGILDSPFMLDDAHSPLGQADADHDRLNDFDDPDHGGYAYSMRENDPLDHDKDGVPNMFDVHYMPAPGFVDNDRDGLHDDNNDVNPGNLMGLNAPFIDDLDRDGYHDDDKNFDGFHDNDTDRDGYRDDDMRDTGMHGMS